MIVKWNNKEFKLLESVELNKSSREVTYSDLKVDFSKKTIEDLPYAQQEVKIYNKKNSLIFTGFVSDYQLPQLKDRDAIQKELSLSLFSPRQMTTKRTITIMTTDKLTNIITQVLSPLYQDGFILKELNIEEKVITICLISRTVEEVLNYLSKKYSLYWNIDEFKRITINSIDYQFNKTIKKNININNYKDEIKGFLSLTPKVENNDYANIINVKNARVFYSKADSDLNITLKKNDRLDFENPIDVSLDTAKRIEGNLITQGVATGVVNLQIIYNQDKEASIISKFNVTSDLNPGITFLNIGKDDSENKLFTLTMDSMFKNLATGITYKGEGNITINSISSQTYLRYANMKLINWSEINKFAGKITPTGQIEKTLDVEQGWFTVEELIDYIRSTFINNDKTTNQVNLLMDESNGLEIGDRLEIDLPEYCTQGNFIITAIKESKERNNPSQYNIELRNTSILENYIDLFRSSIDIEEQTSQTEMEYVVEYVEEETIKEIHEVELDDNYNNTLNFTLRG